MSAQAPGIPNPKLKDRNVLVVEDEEMIASLIKEMLLTLGCGQVWVAGTTKDALAVLAQHQPHVAVLDVNLGGESGFHLAQTLADAGIPFAFASGYGRAGLTEQWASRLMIQKPFKLETLAAALGALL
jgi:CheY-like chemotaxis protein